MPLTLDNEVAQASESGDLDQLADALVRRATQRLQTGKFAGAARDLSDAAGLLRVAGRTHDEARTTLAQATSLRANGELDIAIEAAEQARALAPDGPPLAVAAE